MPETLSEPAAEALVRRLTDSLTALDRVHKSLEDLRLTQEALADRVEVIESTDVFLRRNGGGAWVIRLSPWALRAIVVALLALASAFGISTEVAERIAPRAVDQISER